MHLSLHPGRKFVNYHFDSGRFWTFHASVHLYQCPLLLGILVCQHHSVHSAAYLVPWMFTHPINCMLFLSVCLPFLRLNKCYLLGVTALDCYIAICCPFYYHTLMSRKAVMSNRDHLSSWLHSCTCASHPHSLYPFWFESGGPLLLLLGTSNKVDIYKYKLACSSPYYSDLHNQYIQSYAHLGNLWGYPEYCDKATCASQKNRLQR